MKLSPVLAGAALALALTAPSAHADTDISIADRFCVDIIQKSNPAEWSVFLDVIQNEIVPAITKPALNAKAQADLHQVWKTWMQQDRGIIADMTRRHAPPKAIATVLEVWHSCVNSEMLAYKAILDDTGKLRGFDELGKSGDLAYHAYQLAHQPAP